MLEWVAWRVTPVSPFADELAPFYDRGGTNAVKRARTLRALGYRGTDSTAVPVLSARQAAWLLRKHVARLTDQERACRAALEQQCPVLRNARELGDRLVAILHARDHDAVRAPRCCRWCNGQAEEQVQRLRGIKRSMFGSAGFALFRACIICAE